MREILFARKSWDKPGDIKDEMVQKDLL